MPGAGAPPSSLGPNPNIHPEADTTPGVPDPGDMPLGLQGAGDQANPNGIDLTDLGALQDFLDTQTGAKAVDPTVAAGERSYFDIWGVKPPKGYIKALVGQGLNAFEIAYHELSKPGATRTSYWRDKEAYFASIAAQLFGRR